MSEEKIGYLEALQKSLYSRNPENLPKRKFGILHPVRQKATSTWGDTELPEEKPTKHNGASGYKRFFVFAVFFFAIALGAALFSYYRGAVTLSSKNVDLTILGNSFVGGGEELPVQIEVANKNSVDLTNAELVINYPKGATDETGSDVVRIVRPMGTIMSGKTKSEDFIAILYGEQGISRDIKATLTYQLKGSSATFQKETTYSVMVSSSPVGLTVDAPTAVVSNQSFTLTLHNTFSGDKLLNNVVTRVEYPNGFIFQSAVPAPANGSNVWSLGDLQKGDERTITIIGKLIGEENDEKAFRIYIGTPESDTSSKIAVAYNSALATLHITQPFIAGAISVADKTDDIIALTIGDKVNGRVSWMNTSSQTITNPTFTLALKGDSIDEASIAAANSYYDPLEKTISWTADSDSAISTIAPGTKGELPFSFNTKTSSGSRDISLDLSISGTVPDRDNQIQTINTIDQKIIRFASTIQFGAQSLYSIGPIKNTGPYPPKANADTTYTVTWTLLPTDNPLSNVAVSAPLPDGVNWTNVIVPSTESITFNPDTKLVTWTVGSLPRATAIPKNKTASFQVKVKPTKTQVGSTVSLLGESTVTATDSVTTTPITIVKPTLTTKFDTDPIYTEGRDRVVP